MFPTCKTQEAFIGQVLRGTRDDKVQEGGGRRKCGSAREMKDVLKSERREEGGSKCSRGSEGRREG